MQQKSATYMYTQCSTCGHRETKLCMH